MKFITLLKAIYAMTFSSVQINGYFAAPFPIQRSVRQGCPINMLLFALVLNPLICLLERHLKGNKTVHRTTKTAVVAEGNDVTTFVTAPADIQIIWDLLLIYERVTGACLNTRKSKAMAVGSRDTSMNMLDIP